MNLGIKAAQTGSSQLAVKHLKEATRLYPDNHQAWWNLGQLYSQFAENAEGRAAGKSGTDPEAAAKYAEQATENWEEAIKSLSEAVRSSSEDPMYHMRLGIAYYGSGNPSQAAVHLEKAVELENRLATAYFYLGRVYEDNEEPKKAAEAWSQAARVDPYEGRSFVRLGRLYLRWDMIPQAIKVLQWGKEYVKGDERTNVLYHLGLAHDLQGELDEAISAYSGALDADRSNLDAKFQRGLTYARKGDKSNARDDLEQYVKSVGNSAASEFNKQEANKVLFTLISE
ncbi:MAG: tetratricopeptide repeat protein [Myxococcota bacterium]